MDLLGLAFCVPFFIASILASKIDFTDPNIDLERGEE